MKREMKKLKVEAQQAQAKLELAPGKPPRIASKTYVNFYAKTLCRNF